MSDRRFKLGARLTPHEMLARLPQADRVIAPLPPAPTTFTDYLDTVPSWILGMNDRYGDCSLVGAANFILALTTLALLGIHLSDAEILAFYTLVAGFNPNDPSTDTGCVLANVLLKWHTVGIKHANGVDRIDGFASLDPSDHERIKQVVAHIGPVYIGVNLPEAWEDANVWDVSTAGTKIAGGHCVLVIGYTAAGPLIVSWGQVFTLTWAGWDKYVEEAHAVLSQDALEANGFNPAHVNWAGLESYMAAARAA